MAEIKIDTKLFHERVSHFISAWKTDKRTSDNGVFAGVSSIVIVMGKVEENPEFHKNNAMHVRFPLCSLIAQEATYALTLKL
jgi:nucleosome binding factor SPN SPT16 subunit